MTHRLYIAAVNQRYGRNVFLPLVAGLLWGYARRQPGVASSVELGGMIYLKEPIEDAVARLDRPDILALSSYIWNHEWNKAFARAVKKRWPSCAIVVGGVQVAEKIPKVLEECEAFDFAIYGEGEGAFASFLGAFIEGAELVKTCACAGNTCPVCIGRANEIFSRVGSLVWHTRDGIVVNERHVETPLESIPSPYLEGLFDEIVKDERWSFQALQETNRKCPYSCTFCAWGTAVTSKKLTQFSTERIVAELDWMGRNKVEFLYNCVARGTQVSTPRGRVPIEKLSRGDAVYGWNNGKHVESKVSEVISSGTKDVWRVQIGDVFVEATKEHKILTRKGWKKVGDLCIADEVMLHLSMFDNEQTDHAKDLLDGLSISEAQNRNCKNKSGYSSYNKWREALPSLQYQVRLRASNTSILFDEMRRRGGQSACTKIQTPGVQEMSDMQQNYARQTSASKSVFSDMLGQITRTDCESLRRTQKWSVCYSAHCGVSVYAKARRESTSSDCGQSYYIESKTGIPVDAWKQKSDEEYASGICSKAYNVTQESNAKILERSGVGVCALDESRTVTEQLRATYNQLFCRVQNTISLYWRFFVLAWASSVREVSQSRFHPRTAGSAIGNTRAWSILAPGQEISKRRTKRLSKFRMENLDYLGQRKTRSEISEETTPFCWTKITSITFAGTKEVYDLINVIPSHNFFANGILVSNCDANWGILKRDIALTDVLVATKEQHGYPKKFRAAFAKNSNDVVFEISKKLADAGMLKATTLALQSMKDETLGLIKRKNIKHEKLAELSARYEAAGISTYAEIIVGLPGETFESFIDGLDALLEAGQHDSISIYLCMLLENTEMAQPEYRRAHGIESVPMKALLYHGTPEPGVVEEIQETVVATTMMPRGALRYAVLYGWMLQALHGFGLTQFMARELHRRGMPYQTFYKRVLSWLTSGVGTSGQIFEGIAQLWDDAVAGKSWATVDPRFGDVSWPPEELLFLRLATASEAFYDELRREFMEEASLVDVQRSFFIPPTDGGLLEYAREAVWYGRKGPGRKLRLKD